MRILTTFLMAVLLSTGASAQCVEGDRYVTAIFDSVSTLLDVPYGSAIELNGNTKELVFDYYEPFGDSLSERPLIILAHGGSFVSGDEDDIAPICVEFARYGYVVASINYRLADIVPFGQGMTPFTDVTTFFADELIKATHDFRAAIRYFEESATSSNMFGLDSEKIFIGGVSAGAIAALNAAYMDDEEGVASIADVDVLALIENNGGFEGLSGTPGVSSSNIVGVLNMSGAVATLDIIQADEPPLVSLHETEDFVVPYALGVVSVSGFPVVEMSGSSLIHERAQQNGMNSQFLSFDQVGHVGYFTEELVDQTYEIMIDFMADIVCEEAVETGISEVLEGAKVFPTLVRDELNVEFEGNKNVVASVIDISGNVVYEQEMDSKFSIDCSELSAGMYLLRLAEDGGLRSTKFIVE